MLKMKKVLVTGGAGFIGSHLVDRLVYNGCIVRVIDNLSTGNFANIKAHVNAGEVDFVKGDICNGSFVKENVEDFDVVFHLAAQVSVPYSVTHPDLTYEINVAGTLNLLASYARRKVGKFINVSSCAVYGEPQYLPIDEKHAQNPISPYAESKLTAERYCLGFHEHQLLKAVVMRFINVYGPRQGMNEYGGVITRFIGGTQKKKQLVIYGDGSQVRDFVNVHDAVSAVMAAAKNPEAEGQIFNVGSGSSTSISDLAKTVLGLVKADVSVTHEAARTGDIKASYADISKTRDLLGYSPKVALADGLKSLLSENPSLV